MELNRLLDEKILEIKRKLSDTKIIMAQKLVGPNLDVYIKNTGNISNTIYVCCNNKNNNYGVISYVIVDVYAQVLRTACFECEGECEHTLAVILKIKKDKNLFMQVSKAIEEVEARIENKKVNELMNSFKASRLEANNSNEIQEYFEEIKIIPMLALKKNEWSVQFKIGKTKMYKLKDIKEFYLATANSEVYSYGKALSFRHQENAFCKESLSYLNFIKRHGQMINYINNLSNLGMSKAKTMSLNEIILTQDNIDEFISCIRSSNGYVEINGIGKYMYIEEKSPDIKFKLIHNENKKYGIKLQSKPLDVLYGVDNIYIIDENQIYVCDKNKNMDKIKLMGQLAKFNGVCYFDETVFPTFANAVISRISENVDTSVISDEEREKYIPKKLAVKLKLDLDEESKILLEVVFCYGNKEFNPLQSSPNIARDIEQEKKVLAQIKKDGFLYSTHLGKMILIDEDKEYDFLSEKAKEYMERYEILVTEVFKKKQVRRPKIKSFGVRVENNILNVDLSSNGYTIQELEEILEKYQLKKKYVKLKNGTFIDLQKNSDLDFLNDFTYGMGINFSKIKQNTIKLPINRSLYLSKLLANRQGIQIEQNSEYEKIVEETSHATSEEIYIPNSVDNVLRSYQKAGFKWMKVLDKYNFGGILADDMGLGKTLQVIALLVDAKEKGNVSIVICPSSLILNWYNEINKFAPELNSLVINGTTAKREQQIANLCKYDVCITSYDALKRDVDIYNKNDAHFRYVIADEAQYIKNSNTQNAKSLKELKGKTRFALTGTPIENSLSELWSIFDYIMPGYLYTYSKFKKDIELPILKENDQIMLERLKKLIEPFILRRTKEQVLTELPEKTVTILNNEMEQEQEKIYLAYLAKAKKEIMAEMDVHGLEKSKIKILALLTRLRQLSCHPSLFLDGYNKTSGKLIQCMELIENAIDSGHRILLFSSYAKMFNIIQEELVKKDIQYFKLTGDTNVSDRIEMVDNFNKNPNIKVFLVSLKAGGTGLNLTGADIVIHYDPWWNIAAENQATDRAYRIGQKNNVHVYKLITKNSIEEKIQELQVAKSKIIDNVLDTKNVNINKLSKEEIIELFK